MHKGVYSILPIDENGDIVFVRQYRCCRKISFRKLPAGCLEDFEDNKICAIIELE